VPVPKIRRWNINEAEGRYAATNLPETAIDLHLGMKRRDGQKVPLGRYDLDLGLLAQQGFVTCRQVGSAVVFDVQIYREPDGSLLLGVRRTRTTRLERFRAVGERA
jgi:hypothetical protein